jgi:multiple sugar transport system permease protein
MIGQRKKNRIYNTFVYTFLIVFIIIVLIPYIWLILTSLKNRVDAFSMPPKLFFTPTLANYKAAFLDKGFLLNFKNSVIVTVASTFLSLVIGLPSAYAFSRFPFKGDKALYYYLLCTRFTPVMVLALPLYLIMAKLRLLNTFTGITIAETAFNLAFVVWMMRGFFDTIPLEVDESARVDGCSRFGVFMRIGIPLTRSGLAATTVFCAINCWNEFLMALILTGRDTTTLPVAIPGLLTPQGTDWGQIAAVGSVITIPVLVLAIFVQQHMVKGMTMGAIK